MKTIFVFLLLCLCGISMQAARPDKSDKIAPRWKNGAFPKIMITAITSRLPMERAELCLMLAKAQC